MTFENAISEIDSAIQDRLDEPDVLIEIRNKVKNEHEFAQQLAECFCFTPDVLIEFLDKSIAEIWRRKLTRW